MKQVIDETGRILRLKYAPETLRSIAAVSKSADIASVQLVMSVEDFSDAEVMKACGEFNRAHPELMSYSFTLPTDYTLPTGHILKAGSWVFKVGGEQ